MFSFGDGLLRDEEPHVKQWISVQADVTVRTPTWHEIHCKGGNALHFIVGNRVSDSDTAWD